MKTLHAGVALLSLIACVPPGQAASTGSPFYGDPPDAHHPWGIHDRNRPQPKVVVPGTSSTPELPGKPPSDAIVLFDGSNLSHWESARDGAAPKWTVKDGIMTVAPGTGDLRTKDRFGDCQLHVEWAAPSEVKGDSQGRGNGGIFLMGRVEVQVLDSYNNLSYADGHASAVYGVNPPMANALRPPGVFQAYDIVFRRPIYRDGKVVDPGYVTVFVNGVLTQDHTVLEGGTGHMGRSRPGSLGDKGPLQLQDHGNFMRFRNIWYRELPPRSIEGGTDGYLTEDATMAKRKEIAATIRQDAAKLANPNNSMAELLRLMESLCYEQEPAARQKVEQASATYVKNLHGLPKEQLAAKRDEANNLNNAFKYMTRFNLLPPGFAPKTDLEAVIKEQGWDKRRP